MDTNTYLTNLDNSLILEKEGKERIEKSIGYIKQKLWGIFQDRIAEVKVFGSFAKDTFITGDIDSDVDILLVFKSKDFQPQTYLNQINSFATDHYSRSNIYPDHPTIAIEMEHVKFEIVPAIYISIDEVRIPAPRTKDLKWIGSFPNRLQNKLNEKDKDNKGLIKPLIRILKYWNSINKKPFNSFEIEKYIVSKTYDCKDLREYFYFAIGNLSDIASTNEQKKFYETAKERRRRLRILENYNIPEYIETELMTFLPFR